jgi:nitrogen PTS system EIIA component
MKLASLLNQDLILTASPAKTQDEAVEALIQKMYKSYSFEFDQDIVKKAVEKRETLGGTSFETGIAVCHARLENFDDLIIGICVPAKPIPSEHGELRMIVLILTGAAASTMYLNALASFVSLSKDSARFSKLLSLPGGNEFIDTIGEWDIRVKKDLTVADIMSSNLISVTPETTIRELCDLFSANSLSYIPVLDAAGDFIAEVNITDTIRLGIPDYATMIGSLNFLKTMEPFETLLKNEATLKVSQIMKKPSFKVTRDTSILEVALEMTQNKRRHIAVVDGKKIVGIVSTMDILKKVLRG